MIRLTLVLICLCGSALADPSLRFNGAIRWQFNAPWFGGWSGLEIEAQGTQMTAVNDRGHLLLATLARGADGKLTDVRTQSTVQMGRTSGRLLNKKETDAEGLAISGDGRAFVSFEHRHRIMQTDPENGRMYGRISLPFQNALGDNAGIEALAIGPDGTLFAVAEKATEDGGPFPLYAYSNGQWRINARIPKRGSFLPVGADFDPMGRLWLLERTLTPLGFRNRIRVFVLDTHAPREFTVLTTIPGRYDNLEGISLWHDPSGQMHLTMVSDDNFMRLLRTQIVEYTITD